jgi:hypothetical protein
LVGTIADLGKRRSPYGTRAVFCSAGTVLMSSSTAITILSPTVLTVANHTHALRKIRLGVRKIHRKGCAA